MVEGGERIIGRVGENGGGGGERGVEGDREKWGG